MKLVRYQIWCTTDSKWEYSWLESTAAAPTTCPVNTGHTIDGSKTAIVEEKPDEAKYDLDGQLVVNPGIRKAIAGKTGYTLVSHCFGDRTTWYQNSVRVTDEILTDSGDGLTFNSVNPNWVNIRSNRITYDKDVVPKKDGTFGDHADWDVIVKIDDVVTASTDVTNGWSVNYATGDVTFNNSQSGKTIKCSYSHNDGVTNASQWILNPPSGEMYTIEHVEVNVSKDVTYSKFRMEAWAGASVATYEPFDDSKYNAGYGQEQSIYQGVRDLINVCNKGYTIASGSGLTKDVFVFPFAYTYASEIKSSQGTLISIRIDDDTPFSGCEIGTITFYLGKATE